MMDHGKPTLGSTRSRKKCTKTGQTYQTEQNHLSMNCTNLYEWHKAKNFILPNNGNENDNLPNSAKIQITKIKDVTELLETNQKTQ